TGILRGSMGRNATHRQTIEHLEDGNILRRGRGRSAARMHGAQSVVRVHKTEQMTRLMENRSIELLAIDECAIGILQSDQDLGALDPEKIIHDHFRGSERLAWKLIGPGNEHIGPRGVVDVLDANRKAGRLPRGDRAADSLRQIGTPAGEMRSLIDPNPELRTGSPTYQRRIALEHEIANTRRRRFEEPDGLVRPTFMEGRSSESRPNHANQ